MKDHVQSKRCFAIDIGWFQKFKSFGQNILAQENTIIGINVKKSDNYKLI